MSVWAEKSIISGCGPAAPLAPPRPFSRTPYVRAPSNSPLLTIITDRRHYVLTSALRGVFFASTTANTTATKPDTEWRTPAIIISLARRTKFIWHKHNPFSTITKFNQMISLSTGLRPSLLILQFVRSTNPLPPRTNRYRLSRGREPGADVWLSLPAPLGHLQQFVFKTKWRLSQTF